MGGVRCHLPQSPLRGASGFLPLSSFPPGPLMLLPSFPIPPSLRCQVFMPSRQYPHCSFLFLFSPAQPAHDCPSRPRAQVTCSVAYPHLSVPTQAWGARGQWGPAPRIVNPHRPGGREVTWGEGPPWWTHPPGPGSWATELREPGDHPSPGGSPLDRAGHPVHQRSNVRRHQPAESLDQSLHGLAPGTSV